MKKEEDKKRKDAAKALSLKKSEDEDFEKKKRAAYSAMGKLGGQARAKQLAEKGFSGEKKPKKK